MKKKIIVIGSLCLAFIAAQSFAQKEHHDEKPTNLKVLPNTTTEEDLHKIMRNFSMSLGVHCDYCHVKKEGMVNGHPMMDFASDAKPEKDMARDMMRMTQGINENYIGKFAMKGEHLDPIGCVTCHGGQTSPIVSVDSLKKMNHQ